MTGSARRLAQLGLARAIVIAGVTILCAGFVLHFLTPQHYGSYYGVPLGIRTLLPASAYGLVLLLIGVAYLRFGSKSSNALILALLAISNLALAFLVYDYLTTPYGPELALEVYFFIAQTATYPWIVANVAGFTYVYYLLRLKHR